MAYFPRVRFDGESRERQIFESVLGVRRAFSGASEAIAAGFPKGPLSFANGSEAMMAANRSLLHARVGGVFSIMPAAA